MRITVLCGGPSSERGISLISGKAVAAALAAAGHDVFVADISPTELSALDTPADVIFPVLHGDFGESGELQDILEERDLPFVGSGAKASRLGMDKIAAKQVWRDAGLPTPGWRVLREPPREPGALGLPVIVKAIRSGSSIDVCVCRDEAAVTKAAASLLERHGEVMMEEFVSGTEITVGLLENVALPPIRIETSHAFFDYSAKYTAGGATHSFDTHLSAGVIADCKSLAENASRLLGCRDLGRVDIIVAADGTPQLLEINTIPGFTAVSLLPEAAARAGVPFVELVDRLVHLAAGRAAVLATT
ncbi:MAG TPA: D-alanine--D-alanine ligase [Tepidisphaeraceae bacterium]|jgi:D-alanine-D-alanine ligase